MIRICTGHCLLPGVLAGLEDRRVAMMWDESLRKDDEQRAEPQGGLSRFFGWLGILVIP